MDSTQIATFSSLAGILSTTIFFSMNTTINYLVIPVVMLGNSPVTSDSSPPKSSSSKSIIPATSTPASAIPHLNRQWQEIYWRGHRVGPASAVFSGLAFSTSAYFSSGLKQNLFIIAAVSATSVWPYTTVFMVPTNDELHRRGDAVTAGGDSKKNDQDTMALLAKWVGMSKVRAGLSLVAAVCGVAAFLL